MNRKILYKYVRGMCDPNELRRLGEWLQKDPANEDFFTSFVEGWNENEEMEFEPDSRSAWSEFKEKNLTDSAENTNTLPVPGLLADSPNRMQLMRKKKKRDVAFWSYSLAAIILLIVVSIFVIRQHAEMKNLKQTPQYQEISTIRGQRSNLKLSDGSKVVLNASSTLRIPQNYGNKERTLYLEGEAFFEVTHDATRPFIVISNQVYTKDLGTQFNITAYDSASVEVAVKEGLVSMGKMDNGNLQNEIVEITPNKLGILRKVGGLTVSDIEDMNQYVGWTEGKLVFQRTPFPEVLSRLELWFDIECKVEAATADLNKRTLTATYDNMPMSELLQVMAVSMDVSYEREGRTIVFKNTELDESNLKDT